MSPHRLAALVLLAVVWPQARADTSPATAPATDLVPLRVTLPRPPFHQLRDAHNLWGSPDYDHPADPDRPGLRVPRGVVNVSLGTPVTASDEAIVGTLDLVTDGDKAAVDGSILELPTGRQHVQIDLCESMPIHAIVLWHRHDRILAYRDVIVQVCDEPTFTRGVRTLFNNDADGSAGLGKGADRPYIESFYGRLIGTKGVRGRYVRLYSAGSTDDDDANHYAEVEVHGLPSPTRARLIALRDARHASPEALLAYFEAIDPAHVRRQGERVVEVAGPVRDATDLAHLSRIKTLRALRTLPAPGWGPGARTHLDLMPELRVLDLTGSPYLAGAVLQSPESIVSVEELHLSLALDGAPDATLRQVGHLPRLRALHIVQVTPLLLALDRLAGLERLASLSFADSCAGDRDILDARPLTRITRLDLSRTHVSDRGLAELAKTPDLLPALREIDLTGCDVTDAAVAGLKSARPSLTIVRTKPEARP